MQSEKAVLLHNRKNQNYCSWRGVFVVILWFKLSFTIFVPEFQLKLMKKYRFLTRNQRCRNSRHSKTKVFASYFGKLNKEGNLCLICLRCYKVKFIRKKVCKQLRMSSNEGLGCFFMLVSLRAIFKLKKMIQKLCAMDNLWHHLM